MAVAPQGGRDLGSKLVVGLAEQDLHGRDRRIPGKRCRLVTSSKV
jgi:hypothetical protein